MDTNENTFNFFDTLCVLVGAARMLRSESAKQSFDEVVLMLTGYALAVGGIAWIFDHVVQVVPSGFIGIIIGSVRMAVSHSCPVAIRILREQSAKFRALAEVSAVPDNNHFVRMTYRFLGGFVALLVGVVNGLQTSIELMSRR